MEGNTEIKIIIPDGNKTFICKPWQTLMVSLTIMIFNM